MQIVIEKGIPAPPTTTARLTKYGWEGFTEVGDSALFPYPDDGSDRTLFVERIRNSSRAYALSNGLQFTTRSNSKGVRVWRVK